MKLQAASGHYLSEVYTADRYELWASKPTADEWCDFELLSLEDGCIALRGLSGHYVSEIFVDGRYTLWSSKSELDAWCRFRPTPLGEERIALKGESGHFLHVQDSPRREVMSTGSAPEESACAFQPTFELPPDMHCCVAPPTGTLRPMAVQWEVEKDHGTHIWIVEQAIALLKRCEHTLPEARRFLDWLGAEGRLEAIRKGLYEADNVSLYGGFLYSKHFYDPDSGKNYLGQSDPTALTQGRAFFDSARAFDTFQSTNLAAYNLGLSLHYLTDLTQPMHAVNFLNYASFPYLHPFHSEFEGYAQQIQEEFSLTSAPGAPPRELTDPHFYGASSAEDFLKAAARKAKDIWNRRGQELCRLKSEGWLAEDGTPRWKAVAREMSGEALRAAQHITAAYLLHWSRGRGQLPNQRALAKVYTGPEHPLWGRQGLLVTVLVDTQWSTPIELTPVGGALGPALAWYRGRLHCVSSSRSECMLHVTADFQQPALRQELRQHLTSAGPALAVFQDKLYCIHKGAAGLLDQNLWWTRYDGSTWSPDEKFPFHLTTETPAVATFEGKLYCVHKGALGDGSLWWTTFDGRAWAPDRKFSPDLQGTRPMLAVCQGQLYCFFRDGPGTSIARLQGDGRWSALQTVKGRFLDAVTVRGEHMACAFRYDPSKVSESFRREASEPTQGIARYDGASWTEEFSAPKADDGTWVALMTYPPERT